ncbi:MAG: choice-of-anchor D domain-containing protein [Calditrichia bacterium]
MRFIIGLFIVTSFAFAQGSSQNVTLKRTFTSHEFGGMVAFGDFVVADAQNEVYGDDLKAARGYKVHPLSNAYEVSPRIYWSESSWYGAIGYVDNSLFYIANSRIPGSETTLEIFTVSDNGVSSLGRSNIGSYAFPDYIGAAPDLNALFLSKGQTTIYVYDITSRTNPVYLDLTVPTGNPIYETTTYNGHIFCSTTNGIGVFEINPADPTQLTAKTPISITGSQPKIARVNEKLYVASLNQLRVFDISNPEMVALIGSWSSSTSNINDLAVNDVNELLHVQLGNRITVLDVADPNAINEIGHYQFSTPPFQIEASGDAIYALHNTTLSILEYTGNQDVVLALTPTNLIFEQMVGGIPIKKSVVIRNNGTSQADILSLTSSSQTFSVNDTTLTLNPGESVVREVTFYPGPSVSGHTGRINIYHNGVTSSEILQLQAQTFPDEFSISVSSLWLEAAPIGGSTQSFFSLFNSSLQYSMQVDSYTRTHPYYSGPSLSNYPLAPNENTLLDFTFAPLTPGYHTDTVTVHYHGKTKAIQVTGHAYGPYVELATDTLKIERTQLGSVGEKTAFLKNTGTQDVNITFIGQPDAPFNVSLDSMNIRPGDSLRIQVSFSPTQTGFYHDTMLLRHNAFTSPNIIHLTGEGVFGNASNMVLLGGRDTPGSTEGLTLNDRMVFLADSGNGIVAMNIADPQNISVTSELPILERLHRIETIGNVGYAVAENGFFYTLNLADTAAIALYDDLPLPGTPNDIALQGLYAYVSAGTEGLRIVNIADPGNPFQLSFLNLPGFASGVAVEGNYAFVACGDSGLQVVDVSNLFSPFVAASLPVTGSANELLLEGDRLFVSLTNAGVQEVNVTDPLQPQAQRLIDSVGESVDLATSGDTLYVAALADGVRVHDLSQSNAPEIAFYELPGDVYSIEARSDTVYVAAGNSGLFVLRLGVGPVGTGEETPITINQFALQQNYPNPFNPETRITFDLPQRSNVELIVYDLLGREVQTLKSESLPAGHHQATWNGRDNSGKPQSSGVYVYQLQYETADGQRGMLSEKMIMIK